MFEMYKNLFLPVKIMFNPSDLIGVPKTENPITKLLRKNLNSSKYLATIVSSFSIYFSLLIIQYLSKINYCTKQN